MDKTKKEIVEGGIGMTNTNSDSSKNPVGLDFDQAADWKNLVIEELEVAFKNPPSWGSITINLTINCRRLVRIISHVESSKMVV